MILQNLPNTVFRAVNWPFYAFMLRTKLYQNPFFFTGHQSVNKPKNRAAKTAYGLIFLSFYKNILSFFSFLCQDINKTRPNFAILGCNLSKKHKLTLHKTQNRESNYVDNKFFFNFYLGLPTCTKPWGVISRYYRAGQLFGPCVTLRLHDIKQLTSVSVEYTMEVHFADALFYLSGESPPSTAPLQFGQLFLLYILLSQNW